MTDHNEGGSEPPNMPSIPVRPTGFTRSPGFKFVITGILSFLLMIPALLVWGLVEERAERAREVGGRIAQGWGGEQILNGPYIIVPAPRRISMVENNQSTWRDEPNWLILMPEKLTITSAMDVEERALSIYRLPVYNAGIRIKGHFAPVDLTNRQERFPMLQPGDARFVVAMSDIAGIRSDAKLTIDKGAPIAFSPGTAGIAGPYRFDDFNAVRQTSGGIHAAIDAATLARGFDFELTISLNGSRSFSVIPAGQTTELSVNANWPHPGFDGRFLPESKTIEKDRFSANWTIPFLARGMDAETEGTALPLSDSAMTVNLVEPMPFYQMVSRTLKYAIGILSLVFLAVFVIEIRTDRQVHWIQYVLTGLSLIIFYVLLLALSEQVGFGPAFAIAAAAVTAQVSFYVGSVTRSLRIGASLAAVMALTYAVLYMIMREQDYALLAGSIVAFLSMGVAMAMTRTIERAGPSNPA